jgi:hypothetical protein
MRPGLRRDPRSHYHDSLSQVRKWTRVVNNKPGTTARGRGLPVALRHAGQQSEPELPEG